MREGIGGAWLFQIVVFFVLLFAGILAIAVNYAKAFKVKSEVVSIIERENGVNSNTHKKINDYLNTIGYRTIGKCDAKDVKDKGYPENMYTNGDALYCIKEIQTKKTDELQNQAYYRVKVFFNIDIPIIGNWLNLKLSGTTKVINDPVK